MNTSHEALTAQGKIDLLRAHAPGYRVLIETGLYNGRGSGMELRDLFSRYIVIDLHEQELDDRSIEKWWGDSGERMPGVLGTVTVPALFWLDAHLNAGPDEENHSPLAQELEAILNWPHAEKSTVLADDVGMMGRDGWPTLDEVVALGQGVWDCDVQGAVVRFTPCA